MSVTTASQRAAIGDDARAPFQSFAYGKTATSARTCAAALSSAAMGLTSAEYAGLASASTAKTTPHNPQGWC